MAGLGARVRLRNVATGDELVYSLLGPWDGAPEDGVLSYLSPLGRTFLGRKPGETVEAQLPGGVERYQLVETGSFFDAGP